MNIVGKIHEVGQVQNVSDKFKKRDLILVVSENPEYPEYIKVEFTQDKVDLLNKFSVGQEVEVSINLRGRPFTNSKGETTYYNSIVGWRINALTEGVDNGNSADDDDSGLPF